MYTIGEFSRIGKVSRKMLRHYDSIGLLNPSEVNPDNNYRYYSRSQVKDIMLINKLKRYTFSLKEITCILHNPGDYNIEELINEKIVSIENTINSYSILIGEMKGEINSLRKGLPLMDSKNLEISIVDFSRKNVVALRQVDSLDNMGSIIGKCMENIHKNGLRPNGPIIVSYYNEDFDPSCTDFEVKVPVDRELEGVTSIHDVGTCAKTRFVGLYSELGYAYASLSDYIKEHGYRMTDAPFDLYLTTISESLGPKEQITEVYFPIDK